METPSVRDVTMYLRTTGWSVSGHWRDAQVWTRHDFDVLVPPSNDLADTPARLRELVRCVADAEDRHPGAVWADLLRANRDSVSYRAAFATGAVSLAAGLQAINALRALLVVSAREALGAESHPDAIRTLLEEALLSPGSDGPGVDVALPLTDGGPDPLGRRATQYLRDSAAAILPELAPATAGPTTSPALCLALSDLAGPHRVASFSLTFRWSQGVPQPEDTVRFPEGAGERLRAAARSVRNAPFRGMVEGAVTRLSDDAEGARHQITVRGVLTIDGVVVGRRLVTVRLLHVADYRRALAAHRDGRPIRAEGTATGDTRGRRILTVPPGDLHLSVPN